MPDKPMFASLSSALRVVTVFVLAAWALTALPVVHAAEGSSSDDPSVEDRLSELEERLDQVEDTEGAATPEKRKWNDIIKIKGDLRLRYEGFNWPNHFDDGRRDRGRYRLRLGFIADLHEKLDLGIELRSGNFTDPVSDNTSFDGAGTKDEIAIAQAYARWMPRKDVWAQAGKFSPKKLWHVSDMQWDDDAVVNGAMGAYDWSGDGLIQHADVRGYVFALEENSSAEDSFWYGVQGGPTFGLTKKDTLLVGVGYDQVTNPEQVARNSEGFNDDALFGGNAVTNLVIFDQAGEAQALVSDFETVTLFAEWKNKASKSWPIKASLYFYKNLAAGDAFGIDPTTQDDSSLSQGTDNDTGWFFRLQVGDYKTFKQMAFRYSRYDAKPDAMFYTFTQSDTIRGSNVEANRFDFRIGMPLKGYINVTWYNARPKTGYDDTMNRWQFDYIFRF
jgi:hypothetical protein